jgi:hypothetical protein
MIGMCLTGLIHLEQAGQYALQALSNDGIQVYIDGQRVIDDGKWQNHGYRLSHEAIVDVATAGWYPLAVEYFQFKGTSTSKLMWRNPGSREYAPIPPEVYEHQQPA